MPFRGPVKGPKKLAPAQTILPKSAAISKFAGKTPTTNVPLSDATMASVPDIVSGIGDGGATGGNYDLFATGGTGGGNATGGTMPGGYSSALYNQAFFSNPDALAQDILSQQGIDNAQLTNMLAPTVYGVNWLTSLLGSDQPGETLDVAGQANQVDSLINQLLTPGGQALDPGAIMAALANADPNSAAGMRLSQMSPDDVTNLAMTLLDAAGGNPFQNAGIEAMMKQQGRDYNIDIGRGGQNQGARPYWQNLAGGEFGKYFGG